VSDRREDKEDNPNEGWNPGGGLPMATVAVAAAAGWAGAVREGKRKGGGGGVIQERGERVAESRRQNPRLDSVG